MWTLFLAPALACLWDGDTLATELAGLPGLEQVVYGDFDRLPPDYYRHRLLRVEQQLSDGTATPEDYDDGAVAADRLGLHQLSIAWMETKRALPNLDDDQRYRTEANLGTFYAHRWLAEGGDRRDTSDLHRAIGHLDAALELNPDAHFGREEVQRDLILWLRDLTPTRHPGTYLERSRRDDPRMGDDNTDGLHDVVVGLQGLIVLGAAWESVDVFYTLAVALEGEGRNSAARLVALRAQELALAGRPSLQPGLPRGEALARQLEAGIGLHDGTVDRLAEDFREGRAMADRRSAARQRKLNAKLRQGQHPDTHPGFWDEALPQVRPVPELPSERRGGGCAVAPTTERPLATWSRRRLGQVPQ